MYKVSFNDSDEILLNVKVSKISDNIMQIEGLPEPNLSGFKIMNMSNQVFGIYDEFVTLYRNIDDNTYQVSNDCSVYEEPEIIEPSEEELLQAAKENKIMEMNDMQQQIIKNGVDITLSDGSIEHFDLTDQDQISLMGLQTLVLAGQELIPWHTSDSTEHCKYYSNADMQLITANSLNYVAFNVTYFRDLRIYINSLSDIDEINSIQYGIIIPEELQSEVLKQFYAIMQENNHIDEQEGESGSIETPDGELESSKTNDNESGTIIEGSSDNSTNSSDNTADIESSETNDIDPELTEDIANPDGESESSETNDIDPELTEDVKTPDGESELTEDTSRTQESTIETTE